MKINLVLEKKADFLSAWLNAPLNHERILSSVLSIPSNTNTGVKPPGFTSFSSNDLESFSMKKVPSSSSSLVSKLLIRFFDLNCSTSCPILLAKDFRLPLVASKL